MTPSFTALNGHVYWNGVRLSQESVESLLDLFEREGDQPAARAAWLDLHTASLLSGGIERCTSLRLVHPLVAAE